MLAASGLDIDFTNNFEINKDIIECFLRNSKDVEYGFGDKESINLGVRVYDTLEKDKCRETYIVMEGFNHISAVYPFLT
jgi:hypothetical protein